MHILKCIGSHNFLILNNHTKGYFTTQNIDSSPSPKTNRTQHSVVKQQRYAFVFRWNRYVSERTRCHSTVFAIANKKDQKHKLFNHTTQNPRHQGNRIRHSFFIVLPMTSKPAHHFLLNVIGDCLLDRIQFPQAGIAPTYRNQN